MFFARMQDLERPRARGQSLFLESMSGSTRRATSANMPLLRLQSSEGKFTTSREIEPVRRSFRRRRSCTLTEVARLVPSGYVRPIHELRIRISGVRQRRRAHKTSRCARGLLGCMSGRMAPTPNSDHKISLHDVFSKGWVARASFCWQVALQNLSRVGPVGSQILWCKLGVGPNKEEERSGTTRSKHLHGRTTLHGQFSKARIAKLQGEGLESQDRCLPSPHNAPQRFKTPKAQSHFPRSNLRETDRVRTGTVVLVTPQADILYYTILYDTIQYYTILYDTMRYYTILYDTIQYYTILYYTILYYTIRYYTILYDTIRYYTIRYDTILYYNNILKWYTTILYNTIKYYIILNNTV